MKRTMSYLLALFLGLFVGWLAQQFWLSLALNDVTSKADTSLSRQFQRLYHLQNQSSDNAYTSAKALSVKDVHAQFLDALADKQSDLAIELWVRLENTRLDDVLLLAELLMELGHYEKMLSVMYESRYGLDADEERKLLAAVFAFVEKIDKQLSEQKKIANLVNLYRQLVIFEAERSFYHLRLSYWLLQAGETSEASMSLLGAVNDIRYEEQVLALQDAITLQDEWGPKIDVPLKKSGEHYLVSVELEDGLVLDLMLDTGASKTVIKESRLVQTDPDLFSQGKAIEMNTANGRAKGVVVSLPSLKMQDITLGATDVVIMPLPNFKYDGLLGMNLLSQFDFKIDQENVLLSLTPKKPSLEFK